ncbi:helix-turn-helix domain-containing protein [Chitinasiproducens palmae]|uniref:Helix-turn-helix domain-containing protein n=1 Tax=Chitinasiproducens palmae TaxID=1770053 RepID=A0A1H2PT37_9BURK|nr:hypothetical protein [Chitinasiproducens palmae]SDV49795.1 hypothetical protein SAMN05216551_109143 [Chitinasiproducens palmae]
MSGYAYNWAKRQTVGDSSAKALLKTYAHWADSDYLTWVPNDELMQDTEMDIKTIRKCRQRLIAMGYLAETTARRGGTGSIIVYQMLAPEGSIVIQGVDPNTGTTITLGPPSASEHAATKPDQKRSPSKFGTAKGYQKRSPSKNGAPPNVDASPSTFPSKPLRISPEAPPNLEGNKEGEELEKEGEEQSAARAPRADAARGTRLPADWMLPKAWGEWALAERPGWTAEFVRNLGLKFGDYWKGKAGKDARKVDWLATWRNWVRDERTPGAGSAPGNANPMGGIAGDWRTSASGITAKGAEHGIQQHPDELFPFFKIRVIKAVEAAAAARGAGKGEAA